MSAVALPVDGRTVRRTDLVVLLTESPSTPYQGGSHE